MKQSNSCAKLSYLKSVAANVLGNLMLFGSSGFSKCESSATEVRVVNYELLGISIIDSIVQPSLDCVETQVESCHAILVLLSHRLRYLSDIYLGIRLNFDYCLLSGDKKPAIPARNISEVRVVLCNCDRDRWPCVGDYWLVAPQANTSVQRRVRNYVGIEPLHVQDSARLLEGGVDSTIPGIARSAKEDFQRPRTLEQGGQGSN